jgi:hypothetical protein
VLGSGLGGRLEVAKLCGLYVVESRGRYGVRELT